MKVPIKLLIFCLLFAARPIQAQMVNGNTTLYGNEWINAGQAYLKIPIAEDGLYRIGYQDLVNAGLDPDGIDINTYQLFALGEEIRLIAPDSPVLNAGEHLYFVGHKLRGELDQYLYEGGYDDMLNPQVGLFNDTLSYYLTVNNTGNIGLRYTPWDMDLDQLPAPQDAIPHTIYQTYSSHHLKEVNPSYVFESSFTRGQGFGLNLRTNFNPNLTLSHKASGDNPVTITTRYLTNAGTHYTQLSLDDMIVHTDTAKGYQLREISETFSTSKSIFSVKLEGLASSTDRFGLAYIKGEYLRNLDLSNLDYFECSLAANTTDNYFPFHNLDGEKAVLLIPGQGLVYDYPTPNETPLRVINPATTETYIIASKENAKDVSLESITLNPLVPSDATYIIVSSERLQPSANNEVSRYANYRQSLAGGNHAVAIVNIEDIYNHFGYGVHRHQIALLNFTTYYKHVANASWTHLLMLGKGRELSVSRSPAQLQESYNKSFYIPTFGWPGADNVIGKGLVDQEQFLAIGRVAADDASEIKVYLDKVIEYEEQFNNPQTISDKAWMKRVLHLGGGNSEAPLIKTYLSQLENTITNNAYGAEVVSFFKTSTDPVQTSLTQQIFDEFNEGVGLITFFGHAATGTLDFSINNPDRQDNKGKYPVFVALGCDAGNIHTITNGLSEDFVLYPDKGSIAFFANSGHAFLGDLITTAQHFYEYSGGSLINSDIGHIMMTSLNDQSTNTSQSILAMREQVTLHGDPAIQLYALAGNDYLIDPKTVGVNPSRPTVVDSTIDVTFDLVNLGRNIPDSIPINITQITPTGQEYPLWMGNIFINKGRQSIQLTVPLETDQTFGQNRLALSIDPLNDISETPAPAAENNNTYIHSDGQVGYPFFILTDNTSPIYPADFAIYHEKELRITASTVDPLGATHDYLFEIDTTIKFNSPTLIQETINAPGGVIEWQPNVSLEVGRVYYWRTAAVPNDSSVQPSWTQRSFTYLPDHEPGWCQAHYEQFSQDKLDFITVQNDPTNWAYVTNAIEYEFLNRVRFSIDYPSLYLNGALHESHYGNDIKAGVYVTLIDPIDYVTVKCPPGGQYGATTPASWRERSAFPFKTDTEVNRSHLITFLRDSIPSGMYVYFWTIQSTTKDYQPELWAQDTLAGTDLFTLLEDIGALQVRQLEQEAVPYIFGFIKDQEMLIEKKAATVEDEINVAQNFALLWDEGTLTTLPILSNEYWKDLRIRLVQQQSSDSTHLRIERLDSLGQSVGSFYDDKLVEDLSLSMLDASLLSVEVYSSDIQNKTPVQIDTITITHDAIADLAVNVTTTQPILNPTYSTGETIQILLDITNATAYDMAATQTLITLQNGQNQSFTFRKPLDAIKPWSTETVNYEIPTTNLSAGLYQVIISLNDGFIEKELNISNNILVADFKLQGDQIAPTLSVTFDGEIIDNNDYVLAEPLIEVWLQDSNPYSDYSDTTSLELYLTAPGSFTPTRIYFNDSRVTYFPQGQTARLVFQPTLLPGTYSLRVEGYDIARNPSGAIPYEIMFRVSEEDETISGFTPISNPSIGTLGFRYNLISQRPIVSDYEIRLYDMNGRWVLRLTADELGPLSMGEDQTTDVWAHQLAAGVYIYHVTLYDKTGASLSPFNEDGFKDTNSGKVLIAE